MNEDLFLDSSNLRARSGFDRKVYLDKIGSCDNSSSFHLEDQRPDEKAEDGW